MSYWYLPARSSDGSLYLLGPYMTEYECLRKADTIDIHDDPIQFKTRNINAATRIYKEKLVGTTEFDNAVKKIKHTDITKPEKYFGHEI